MQIDQLHVTVGDVCEGYFNDAVVGVVGYDERLVIRHSYLREFIYKDGHQRNEVIRTVLRGLPLNVMYACASREKTDPDGYEVLDKQQRTISLCEGMLTARSLWMTNTSIIYPQT